MSDMESCMTGRGYPPRRMYPRRRYRRNAGRCRPGRPGQSRIGRILAIQTLVCAILLFIAVLARVLGNTVAGFVAGKIRHVLEHDMELKNIYAYAETLAADIRSSIFKKDGGSGEDDDAGKSSTGADSPDAPAGSTAGDLLAADSLTEDDMSDDPENTATLSAELSLPDTVDASSGVSGTYGDGTEAGSEEARQHDGTGSRVLSASTGDIGDPAESSGDPGKSTDGSVPSGSEKREYPGMTAPAEGKVLTPFGETEGAAGMRKMHTGIDIAVDKMSSVRAALDGYVEDAGTSPGYGKFIKIRHSKSLVTVYANCSSIIAGIGENVKKGDVIAVAGGERIPGGSHIHFEVWLDGVPADPLDYLDMEFR